MPELVVQRACDEWMWLAPSRFFSLWPWSSPAVSGEAADGRRAAQLVPPPRPPAQTQPASEWSTPSAIPRPDSRTSSASAHPVQRARPCRCRRPDIPRGCGKSLRHCGAGSNRAGATPTQQPHVAPSPTLQGGSHRRTSHAAARRAPRSSVHMRSACSTVGGSFSTSTGARSATWVQRLRTTPKCSCLRHQQGRRGGAANPLPSPGGAVAVTGQRPPGTRVINPAGRQR
jgi:hypothetical protein